MIRWREIVREAWRDTATGTSRCLLAVLLFAGGVGALAWAQVSGIVGIAQEAAQWVDAGAAVRVIELGASVDGRQCEALASIDGVLAAGALRPGAQLRLAAMPSRVFHTFEATPGMRPLLGVGTPTRTTGSGVWMSQDLADSMAIRPGEAVSLHGQSAFTRMAGIFPFPVDDGRNPILAYSILQPVSPVGVFDSCWVEMWPETPQAETLARLVVNPVPPDESGQRPAPQTGQLNASLGIAFNAQARLERLPTVPLNGVSAALGLFLGVGLVRLRRLELASALHAGIPRSTLALQTLIEAAIWVLVSAIAMGPVLWWVCSRAGYDASGLASFAAAQVVALAAISAVLGTIAATITTRERHLFRLFKAR